MSPSRPYIPVFALVMLTLLCPIALLAQGGGIGNNTTTPIAGVPHNYITGLNETVNPANGALSIRISQPVPHERGQNWPQYAFIYESNSVFGLMPGWQTLGTSPPTTYLTSLTACCTLLPQYPSIYASVSTATTCLQNGQFSCVTWTCVVNSYSYIDPNGGKHGLGIQRGIPQTSNSPNDCTFFGVNNYYYGGDEQYKASMDRSSFVVTVADLHGNLPLIEDSNGNFGDTTHRTAHVPALATIQPGSVTESASFNVLNNSQDIACRETSIPAGGNISTPQSVTLPNGELYRFQYDPVLGLLNKITYPTGATVTYTWTIIPKANGVQYHTITNSPGGTCSLQYDWFAITKRVVSYDGITNAEEQDFAYTTAWPNAQSFEWSSKTTTLTTKDLIRGTSFSTVYTYAPMQPPAESDQPFEDLGVVPVEKTVQYYGTDGSLLKTTTKSWASESNLAAECDTLPNGQISGKFYTYQPYAPFVGLNPQPFNGDALTTNLPTDIAEYDYGQVSTACVQPGTSVLPVRETVTAYQAFANSPVFAYSALQDRPSSVKVYGVVAGTKALAQETDYAYDGTSPAPVTPLPYGHDENGFGSGSPSPRGNPTTITKKCFIGATNCTNSVTTYTYDTTGQVLTATDANLHTTTYSYTDNYTTDQGSPTQNTNAYVTQVTRPATGTVSHVTKFQYGFNDGELRNTTDENNLVTTYCYWTGGCSGTIFDPFARLTGISASDGGTSTITYVDAGPSPSVTTSKAINSAKTLVTTNISDGLGHPTQTQLTSDPQGTVFTETTYDGLGQVFTVSNPHRTCGTDLTSSCGTSTYVYDSLGRKTSQTYPDGSVLATAYCSSSTLVTDPTKRWRRSRTDALGRLVEVDEPNSPTAAVNSNGCPNAGDPIWTTTYTFDALNNLTNVLQNGSHARSFTYDSLSRLLTSINPEVGTLTYTYDANGNVQTKKDARAIATTYSYDALNRETGSTYSNGDPAITLTYDQSACLGLTACQNIGHRTGMTDAGGSEAWAYQTDKPNLRSIHADQRTNKASPVNITMTVTSYFDLADNLTQLHYPSASGRVVNYSYDAADRPSSAIDNTNAFNYATGWQTGLPAGCVATAVCYTPQGAIYGISFGPTSTFTGFNITNTYNNRLMALEFKASSTAGNAIDITYSYVDPVKGGNAGHVFSVTNNLNASRTQSFTYDQVNRILSAGTSSTTGSYCWGYQFSYDAWGNLLTQAGWAPTYNSCSQGMLPGVTADGNNHISMFAYDASGNATSDTTNTYTWDGESQLKSAAGVTYLYDGDGRRVSKSNGKLYWYGPGGEIIAETDATGHKLNDYIFFAGKHIGTQSASGVGAFYVEDFLGSSRVLTTTTGTVCYDADFTPYGGERAYTNTCQNVYKFEGKERDAETGNDDFGDRYYNNRFGRWLSADWSAVPAPIPYANLSNPQTLNLYSMVSDDPESFGDLDGHGPCLLRDAQPCGDDQHPKRPPWLHEDEFDRQRLCPGCHPVISSSAAGILLHVFEHAVGEALKDFGEALVKPLIFVGAKGAIAIDFIGELTIFAPSAGSRADDERAGAAMKENTKGARPSTEEKHEKGKARKRRDRGGEKGDARRGPPRKRPKGWEGQWPPAPGTRWW